MNTTATSNKKQTAFRFSSELIDALKVRARRENRSLNNYVEKVLMDVVFNDPNDVTVSAMKDAKESKSLDTLDLSKFKEFVASL